jgi:pimeloyl-ACP methyl ester carboxylesterase
VTIVLGGGSDPAYAAIAVRLAELVPRARVVVVPGTDHMGAVTRPDLLLPVVRAAFGLDRTDVDRPSAPTPTT